MEPGEEETRVVSGGGGCWEVEGEWGTVVGGGVRGGLTWEMERWRRHPGVFMCGVRGYQVIGGL